MGCVHGNAWSKHILCLWLATLCFKLEIILNWTCFFFRSLVATFVYNGMTIRLVLLCSATLRTLSVPKLKPAKLMHGATAIMQQCAMVHNGPRWSPVSASSLICALSLRPTRAFQKLLTLSSGYLSSAIAGTITSSVCEIYSRNSC